MTGITYDAGALIAAERDDRLLWAMHRAAVRRGAPRTVPAAVLAQVWRGGPQAQLSRLLRGCEVENLAETEARAAGALCGMAGTSDVVDAALAISAIGRKDAVVTADPDDIGRLVKAAGASLVIHRV